MKIKIKKCSDARYWYNDCVGLIFNVAWKNDKYWVKASDGYLNFIELDDVIEISDERIVKVLGCSNPVLWYNSHKGETFEITKETYMAYWVKLKQPDNCKIDWIYKKDCEVIL